MRIESSGKPDAWKLARPVWGWGRGAIPRPTPLRTLLIFVTLCAIPLGCLRCLLQKLERAQKQAAAVAAIYAVVPDVVGSSIPTVVYDYQELKFQHGYIGELDVPEPFVRWLGKDFFSVPAQLNVFGQEKFTDALLGPIADLNTLTFIRLNGCYNVTDTGLAHFKGADKLRVLILERCDRITDDGLKHLKGLTQLRWLSLAGDNITDAGLAHLKGLTGLRELTLTGTKITGAGLKYVAGMTQLQRLYFSSTQVDDAGLEYLKDLKRLDVVDRSFCPVTREGMLRIPALIKAYERPLMHKDPEPVYLQ